MKLLISIFNLFTLVICLHGQNKQDYVWLGGYDPSPSEEDVGFRFDFNNKPFTVTESNNGFRFDYNIASICDEAGELLFYSNGCAIINAEAQMMPNGDSINYNEWHSIFWGGDCEYGYPGSQDIMILPDPGYEDGYYVFHKANVYFPNVKDSLELMMSYVDMRLDHGRGDVVYKNVPYYDRYNLLYSYFTAIQHSNGEDWWIIQPLTEDSIFLTYILTKNGVERKANQNSHEFFMRSGTSGAGTSKFSPDGTKYAFYAYKNNLHVYDFDRNSGILTNHKKIIVYDSIDFKDIRFNSVEWSSNSRFIYTASRDELHQIDTWEKDLNDGIRLIDVYNGTQDPFPTNFYLMALGPDCRIYMRSTNGSNSYHVINHPDSLGKACDFVQNGIKLPVPSGGGLPNFPRFRVDDEEKCDPTIVSVFGESVWYRRDLKVWPNPSSGVFYVELPKAGKGQLVVIDMNGQIVHDIDFANFADPIRRINISYLPSGRYNVEFWPERNNGLKPNLSRSREPSNNGRVFYGSQVVKVE